MISRILHQGWVGPKPMPQREQTWCEQMRRMNPTWDYRRFGNEIMEKYGQDPYVKELINQGKPWAFICDRLRVLILREEGGVWLDPDCQPVKPLDTLSALWDSPTATFAAGFRSPDRPEVALHRGVTLIDNTFLATAPKSRMIERIAGLWRPGSVVIDGHAIGIEVIRSADTDTVILGHQYFYSTNPNPKTIVLHDSHNLASWVEQVKGEQRARLLITA